MKKMRLQDLTSIMKIICLLFSSCFSISARARGSFIPVIPLCFYQHYHLHNVSLFLFTSIKTGETVPLNYILEITRKRGHSALILGEKKKESFVGL